MSDVLRVLAIGAGGPFAGLVVPALSKRGVQVRGFVHKREDEATARNNGAAEVATGDISDSKAVLKALEGMDAAFYIAPIAIENESKVGEQFVDLAKRAGVRRIVFSSLIHPILSALENHAAKAPVEEAIVESGMEYVLLHPAVFFQNMAEGWKKAQETGVYAEPWSNDTHFSRVDYRDVAEVAAIGLTEDRLLYGTFELASEGALNRKDVARLMSEVAGRPVRAEQAPQPKTGQAPEQLIRMMQWYDKHSMLGNAIPLRAILGRAPRTLLDYLTELRSQV